MSARPRRLLPPVAGRTHVERIELQQFARRLHDALTAKGMSQSDLAREIWGSTQDTRGYTVAKNRDRIGSYLRGESVPEPQNLARMAEALGTTPEDLAPDIAAATVDRENPELAFTMVAGHPDKVHLQVNKLVDLTTATQVITLLTKAANSDPLGGDLTGVAARAGRVTAG